MAVPGSRPCPGGGVVTAKAGSVTEVPLSGVPAGQYTVSATSDVSIVAAARVSRGLKTSQSLDFAWSPATDQLGSQHVVPLPQGGERLLVFGALDDRATISYTPITADGKLRTAATADIAAGTTTTLKAPDRIGNSAVVGYWYPPPAERPTAPCCWNGKAGTTSPPWPSRRAQRDRKRCR